jgi:hypothetical protein
MQNAVQIINKVLSTIDMQEGEIIPIFHGCSQESVRLSVVDHGFQCGPDPDPDPGSQTNADSCGSGPDPDPGHKKLIFYMKNIYNR